MLAKSLCFIKGTISPIIPFAKTNGKQLGMSAKELTLLLLTVFLCKYTKVVWLFKGKGFHNSFPRVQVDIKSKYFIPLVLK